MRLTAMVAACVAHVLTLFQSAEATQEEAIKSRFLADYAPAVKRLEGSFSKARIKARIRKRRFAKEDSSHDLIVSTRDPLYRLEVTSNTSGATMVIVANPRCCFLLRKKGDGAAFTLDRLGKQYDEYLNEIRLLAIVPFAAYSELEIPILEFVTKPLYKVRMTRIQEISAGAKRLVKVEYDRERGNRRLAGSLTFAPSDSWALQESASGSSPLAKSRQMLRAVVEYAHNEHDAPVIRKAEQWVEDSGTGERSQIAEVEVLDTQIEDIPEREFTLAAFGLPDIEDRRTIPAYFYFIAIGIFALIAGIVLRYMAKRGSR